MKRFIAAAALALALGAAALPAQAQIAPYNQGITITTAQAKVLQSRLILNALKGTAVNASGTGLSQDFVNNLATTNKIPIQWHKTHAAAVNANPSLAITLAQAVSPYRYGTAANPTLALTKAQAAKTKILAARTDTNQAFVTGVLNNPAYTTGYTGTQLAARQNVFDALFPLVTTFTNLMDK